MAGLQSLRVAGRGLGRSHAMALAKQGAAVVVNDLGVTIDGSGEDATQAQQVVNEILGDTLAAPMSAYEYIDWINSESALPKPTNQAVARHRTERCCRESGVNHNEKRTTN